MLLVLHDICAVCLLTHIINGAIFLLTRDRASGSVAETKLAKAD